MAKSYKVSVFAGTKVVADMAQQVKNATIDASLELKPIAGGATEATAVLLPVPNPLPVNSNRKRTKAIGWYKNATGPAWEAPKDSDNVNWWSYETGLWSLGSSVPLPKAKDGQGLLPLWDSSKVGGYLKDAQVRDPDGVSYVSLKDANTSALSVAGDWKVLSNTILKKWSDLADKNVLKNNVILYDYKGISYILRAKVNNSVEPIIDTILLGTNTNWEIISGGFGSMPIVKDYLNKASDTGNIGNTYLFNNPNIEGREISIYISGPANAGIFTVAQRSSSGGADLKSDQVPINTLVKTTIFNNDINRFFFFKNSALAGEYRFYVSLISNTESAIISDFTKVRSDIVTNSNSITTTNNNVTALTTRVNNLESELVDEKINIINSLTAGSDNRLIGSVLFKRTGLGGRKATIFVSSPNDVPLLLFQREGTTNKGADIVTRTNTLVEIEIFDNTVDRIYSYSLSVVPGVYTFTINLISNINEEFGKLNDQIEGVSQNVTAVDNKVNELENIVDNIQISSSGIPPNFQEKTYKFGNTIQANGLIGSALNFQVFGNLKPVIPQGSNVYYVQNKSVVTESGLTWRIENNTYILSGKATKLINFARQKVILPKGTYTFRGFVEGDVSDVLWTGLHVRLAGAKVAGTPVIISSYGAITHTVESDSEVLEIYLSTNQNVTINGEATVKIMINAGSTGLSWVAPSDAKVIDFNVKNFNINLGSSVKSITNPKTYGLAVIPTVSTATTANEQEIATYADAVGNCFIADSVEYRNGTLYHVQRVGKKVFNTGDTIPTPYLSANMQGLVNGYDVYYKLPTPIETSLGSISQEITAGISIGTNNNNAYLYANYNVAKDIINNPIVFTRQGMATIDNNGWDRGAVAIDGKFVYAGGRFGVLEKIDNTIESAPVVTKVTLDAENIIRAIVVNGDYLYVIDRDPTAATVYNTTNKGNLFIVNKDTLAIVNTIRLYNKGCGAGIYKNHLYVMEQMYDWQVFNLTNPALPVLTYTFNGSYLNGEYQNCAFWTNNNIDYMVVTSFEHGIQFFNITNPASPFKVGGVPVEFNIAGDGTMQAFDVVVNFPYCYFTVAPDDAGRKFAKDCYRGVISINISDISKYSTSAKLSPSDYNIANIPYQYWSKHISEGDLHPSRIKMIGDVLITNNGNNGLASYRITNGVPKFEKNISFGGQTYALAVSKDGRLAFAPYSRDIVDGKTYAYLYRLGNLNFG